MAQVLSREFDCLTCHEPIKIAKLDNVPAGQRKKWERFELDGVTPHKCKKEEQEEETAPIQQQVHSDSEVAALTEEVRGLRDCQHFDFTNSDAKV